MFHEITVAPAPGGWAVRTGGVENDMLFLSGASAESAARKLAANVADAGEASEILIYLRDGTLAGRFVCPGALSEPRHF